MIGTSSVQPSMCQSKVPVRYSRHRVLRRVESDPEDLRVLPPAEDLDPSQRLAEGDLRGVIDVQAAKDEGAMGFEDLEHPGRQAHR